MNNPFPSDDVSASQMPLKKDKVVEESVVVPLLEEQLHVEKQLVETGRVRMTKTVLEEPQTVQIPLTSETVEIERVSLNQYVDEPPLTRQEGETTIYSVLKEVLVVEKRLMLIEEIRVTRRQSQTRQTLSVPLRREDVRIERIDATSERPAPPESSL